jgi:hypothetical protein
MGMQRALQSLACDKTIKDLDHFRKYSGSSLRRTVERERVFSHSATEETLAVCGSIHRDMHRRDTKITVPKGLRYIDLRPWQAGYKFAEVLYELVST